MYNLESLWRRIQQKGVEVVINDLVNCNLSDEIVEQMTKEHILCNGYPNLSLIYSLIQ